MVALRLWCGLLLVSLCVGLAISVLIAWASAAWMPLTGVERYQWWVDGAARNDRGESMIVRENRRPSMARRAWALGRFPPMGRDRGPIRADAVLSSEARERFSRDLRWGRLSTMVGDGSSPWTGGVEDARGWPCLCLYWTSVVPPPGGTLATVPRPPLVGGSALGLRGRPITHVDTRALPWLPIWRGLLFNSVFFAALLVAAVVACRSARCIVRRCRGRCPRCAYDLRSDLAAGCPECGWGRAVAGPAL